MNSLDDMRMDPYYQYRLFLFYYYGTVVCLKWIAPDRIQDLNEIISEEFGILYYALGLMERLKGSVMTIWENTKREN